MARRRGAKHRAKTARVKYHGSEYDLAQIQRDECTQWRVGKRVVLAMAPSIAVAPLHQNIHFQETDKRAFSGYDKTHGAQQQAAAINDDAPRKMVPSSNGERERGWGVYPILMHGLSRMTIDPRTPTMPRRSTSGCHQPGRHCYVVFTKREAPCGVRRAA